MAAKLAQGGYQVSPDQVAQQLQGVPFVSSADAEQISLAADDQIEDENDDFSKKASDIAMKDLK